MPKPKSRILGGLCARGHLLTIKTTYIVKATGYLQCKTCQLERQARVRFLTSVLRKDREREGGVFFKGRQRLIKV